VRLRRISFEIDGQQVHGYAVKSSRDLWVHVQNRTIRLPLKEKKFRSGNTSASVATESGEITAPMPGKLIKISVQEGEAIKSGQTILVMEAMKMEYALKAPFDGKVSFKNKKIGEQVSFGETLAKVEK